MAHEEELRVERLRKGLEPDFMRLHCAGTDRGWCRCVAWWVPTWEGWGERTAEENLRLRQELFERGEHDGYLCFAGAEPVGWCQVGPRDRLAKLVSSLELAPDAGTWALSCFLVAPEWRRRGVARQLLQEVLRDLSARGARRLEAYPKRGDELDAGDLWNGPLELFLDAGFTLVMDGRPRAIVARELV